MGADMYCQVEDTRARGAPIQVVCETVSLETAQDN